MLNAEVTPVLAPKHINGVNFKNLFPKYQMLKAPKVERENENIRAIFNPTTFCNSDPTIAPKISALAEANAFIKMSPGRNLSVRLN
jgi:hypothetical protein